ncbi:MAG: hypothetical protein RJP95_04885 [Pirellulales bacterium]
MASGSHASINSARTAALLELDRWLASLWCYLFLQRMSIMAPLLGVLITAGGFLSLELPDGKEEPVRVLAAITPLVIGVGGGALLAFFNQLLLQIADTVVDRLHTRCGKWYDARFLVGELENEQKRERSQELEMAESLLQTAKLNERLTSTIAQAEVRTSRYAEQLQDFSRDLADKLDLVPDRMQALISTTDGTAKTLTTLAPLISQITDGFSSGVEAFRDVVDTKLVDSLTNNLKITSDTAELAASCKLAIDQLADGSSLLKELAESQATVTRNYLDILENRVTPQQDEFSQIAQRLEMVVSGIVTPLDSLWNSLQRFSDRVEGCSEGMEVLRESTGLFSKAVADQFVPAAELHRSVMAGVESDSVHAREDAAAMRQAVTHFVKSSEDFAATTSQNRQLLEQHAQPAHTMLERAAREFERAAEAMAEHADSYRTALISHSNGVSRLDDKVEEAIDAIQKASTAVSSSITSNLKASLTENADVTHRYGQVANKLLAAIEELQVGASGIRSLSESYSGANEGLRDAILSSRDVMNSLNDTSSELRKAVREGVVASQAEYNEAVNRMTTVTAQLDRFLGEGAGALTERIHALEGVFSSFRESIRGITTVAEASKDAERFMSAMENTAALVESLEKLVQRLGEKSRARSKTDGENNKSPKKTWSFWRKG